jgi:hypothetical protein
VARVVWEVVDGPAQRTAPRPSQVANCYGLTNVVDWLEERPWNPASGLLWGPANIVPASGKRATRLARGLQ